MKPFTSVFTALLLFAACASAQVAPVGQVAPNINYNASHYASGFFNAPSYATWGGIVISGNTSTGAGTSIIVYCGGSASGTCALKDGTSLPLATVFNTNTPIAVDLGQGAGEVFTPSSVSIGTCPAGNLGVGGSSQCATVTGTIGNTHGQSALVSSGDMGIEEAITDAGVQGGGNVYFERDCGNVVLSTGGLTTTVTGCSIPLNAVALGASAFVKTTITTATSYSLGIAGNTTTWISGCTALTAGLNCSAKSVAPAETATGTSFALSAILVTAAGGTPGAGAVHVKLWGYSQVSSIQ